MDRWKREGLLNANNGLRNQIEDLLDTFQQQQTRLAETYRQLEETRIRAESVDRSVAATVDAGGVLTELSLTPSALRKSPEELARAIVETVGQAAERAREHQQALISPATEELEKMGDFSDLVPEVPDLGDVRSFLRGERNSSQ
ncbi:YbaB/EbfC family nucleoid-associated protein [Nocardia testacea]|uniref:YbaB/EbfC family nucleoid-associated protein n=1 Tax=Nocardia testacea TaxID=248551 RepID=UPI0002D7FD21|nr:YbaB/EbfC family nucleoid-associated protein [Nocardia testacea]